MSVFLEHLAADQGSKQGANKMQDVGPLSAGEMEILQILWKNGGATISQAQNAIGRPIGYTTIQTRLNRLVEKGLAVKSPERPTRYLAEIKPAEVSAGHLDLLLERVSNGHVVPLIAQLMKGHLFSHAEIEALKNLVDELELHETEKLAKGGRQ